ncbi:MAG: AMP-binding protein [Crocinitomicaceae bacterium]
MKFCFENKEFIDLDIHPSQLAVIGSDMSLTWHEFKAEVDHLVDYLSTQNLNNLIDPVVLYGHKSARMIISAYALMQLKIPYIPVDEIYPLERVQKIISASGSQLLINTSESDIDFDNISSLFNAQGSYHLKSLETSYRTDIKRKTNHLVYIIFTSGSTGEPKGVQISTEAVQSFTKWMTGDDFKFSSNSVLINTAPLSFDLSVFELMTFGALGATLLLNTKAQTSDPTLLLDRIQKYNGSVWVSTPSFALIYSRIDNNTVFNQIEAFLFCGEILPHPLAKTLVKKFPKSRVINTYGPTEATVATTIVTITNEVLEQHNPLPVGISKVESKLEIIDDEIVIIGPNVASGYVNRPDLNASKFTKINGERAFRTGDKGYLENGLLFFHGRNDDMVKLHGYRIELNEITSVLDDFTYILQSATIPLKRNDTVKKIVSLVQLQPNVNVELDTIKNDLEKTLPKYMVPADIKIVNEIPLNQNGKADKNALLALYLKKK